jgi:hypothetical protein
MPRAALRAMAFCLALLLVASTAQAARPLPNQLALTPEQRRELELRNAYCRVALGVLGGVLALGALGQLVYSIRNFQRVNEEERAGREEDPMAELDEAFDTPSDDFTDADEAELDAGPPIETSPPRRSAPCGIIANHLNRPNT